KNIVDREAGKLGKGNIKEEKGGEYPLLANKQKYAISALMISLENTLGISHEFYNIEGERFYAIKPMKEYQEGKSLAELREN
ncbi:11564_t:CDS:1, partial [Racocetra fulgida]